MDYHLFPAVRHCLFNIIAATLHIWRPSPPSATWRRITPCTNNPFSIVEYIIVRRRNVCPFKVPPVPSLDPFHTSVILWVLKSVNMKTRNDYFWSLMSNKHKLWTKYSINCLCWEILDPGTFWNIWILIRITVNLREKRANGKLNNTRKVPDTSLHMRQVRHAESPSIIIIKR
jgi:hypothetical protein